MGIIFEDLSTAPDTALAWQLVLNVDTSDGNVVHFCNTAFWESPSELGGAGSDFSTALTGDYKDLAVFSGVVASKLLVVVHQEGGAALGWRQWALTEPQTLAAVFASPDTRVASGSMGDYVDSLSESEPMVRNTVSGGPHTDDLWVNSDTTGGGNDWNRMVPRRSGDDSGQGNLGWGLGTSYDSGNQCNGLHNDGMTSRPLCDAQMHVTQVHWGSGGGIGGMIGSDNLCNGGCPWTIPSGLDYDYAIYVAA